MFDVFVPRSGSWAARSLVPGSAVVSPSDVESRHPGMRCCDYEGNLYGSDCLSTYADRLLHAAGRSRDRYPTVARSLFDEKDLILVGYYNLDERTLRVEDAEALESWLGGPPDGDFGMAASLSGAELHTHVRRLCG